MHERSRCESSGVPLTHTSYVKGRPSSTLMGIIGARCEDKVCDGSRCKKSVIPLLHTCGAKGKSFLWENSSELIETRAVPCRVGPVASGGEDWGDD